MKAAIAEKTVPKSIKILKRTTYVLMIIVIVLASVSFGEKLSQVSDIKEGIEGITNSYNRHNIMADINYYARKMWLSDNNYTDDDPTVYFYPYRTNLTDKIDEI